MQPRRPMCRARLPASSSKHDGWGSRTARQEEEDAGVTLAPGAAGAKRAFAVAVGLATVLAWIVFAQAPMEAAEPRPPAAPPQMDSLLEPLRAQHRLPALAAVVIKESRMVALGAVGLRKLGAPQKVTPADKFHLGSCTKSMTATLAAMFVEQGQLRWDTTLGELFPERAQAMHAAYRHATLEQLLSHRGGAPAALDAEGLLNRVRQHPGTAREQRLALLDGIVTQPPAAPPGTKCIYSNAGYAIAAAMVERIAGKAWEELLRERLFHPLGMASAGFGAPATDGRVDQPWGHTAGLLEVQPVPPGPAADNPPALAPAGSVHCSLGDLASYLILHLQGARGAATLLQPETFKKLHAPVPGQDYALGWLGVERGWAGGTALTHAGSNTMFYVVIWIALKRDFAVAVATNVGGSRAERGCDETAWKLIQEYLLQ